MDSKLFATRKQIYSRSPSIFWLVSIFVALLALAIIALEVVAPGLYLLTFCFIFIPVFFASFVTLFTIKYGGTLSLKSTLVISRSYFRNNSFGVFRLIKTFIKYFIVRFLTMIVFTFILDIIFTNIYGDLFVSLLEEVQNSLGNLEIITEEPLMLFFALINALSFSCSFIVIIYSIIFNSLCIYISASLPDAPASVSTSLFSYFVKTKGSKYKKDFWSLNWPLFALLILGITVGYVIFLFFELEEMYAIVLTSACGIVFMIPFLPFMFANMEALFAKYEKQIKSSSQEMAVEAIKKIKARTNLSAEELDELNDILKKSEEKNKEKDSDDGV